MAESVLDASALLAYMHDEPGADAVADALERGCAISVVNVAEALSKLADAGDEPADTLEQLETLGEALEMVALDAQDVAAIARLRPTTRDAGLSLGDRACLALAHRLGLPALTTDGEWKRVDVGVEIAVLR